MTFFRRKFLLLLVLGVLTGCLPGCSTWDIRSLSPWHSSRGAEDANIVTPANRMARLREMAARAPSSSQMQREEMAKDLAKAIDLERDPLIRCEMLRTLAVCATPTADAVLLRSLKDDTAAVRVVACDMLGRRGGSQAAHALAETLGGDVDLDVRLAAARALGQTGERSAVDPLGQALAESDPALQYQAVDSLRNLTGEDFGNDVDRWQSYVRGEPVPGAEPVSIAERLQQWRMF